MLRLAYNPEVPATMIDLLEHHARALGLPLATVEAIGQSLDLVEAFVTESEAGRGQFFADFVLERGAAAVAWATRAGPATA